MTRGKHQSKALQSKGSTQTIVNVSTPQTASSAPQSKQSSPSSLNQKQSITSGNMTKENVVHADIMWVWRS